MATKKSSAVGVEIGVFEFSVNTKREDGSNGFLDLKEDIVQSGNLGNCLKKGVITCDREMLSEFEINKRVDAKLVLQNSLTNKGEPLANVKLQIVKKIETEICGEVYIEEVEILDKVPLIKKYNKDCITIDPEKLSAFHIDQHIIVSLFLLDEIIEEDEAQEKIQP